mmetsp:Transcript_8699/g.32070  ORF Transcript_8699/g.32070 Transcript_8699/m.32070 type:complete len:158 (+) Transcript_8699:2522-2995(+)
MQCSFRKSAPRYLSRTSAFWKQEEKEAIQACLARISGVEATAMVTEMEVAALGVQGVDADDVTDTDLGERGATATTIGKEIEARTAMTVAMNAQGDTRTPMAFVACRRQVEYDEHAFAYRVVSEWLLHPPVLSIQGGMLYQMCKTDIITVRARSASL